MASNNGENSMRGRRQAASQQGLSDIDAVQNPPPRLLVFHNKRETIEVSEKQLMRDDYLSS